MNISNKKILYAVSSQGYGHVQRELPIIKSLLPKNSLIIVSFGRALKLLQKELSQEKNVVYHELEDLPHFEAGKGILYYPNMIYALIKTIFIQSREHKFALALCEKEGVDMIFADGRYGFYNEKLPSFLMCHQVRIYLPKLFSVFQPLSDIFQYLKLKKFNRVFIPDFESDENNLAGKLAHNWITKKIKPLYLGYLSTLEARKINEDIEILFITGGFLEDEKQKFIASINDQLKQHKLKKAFILGGSEEGYRFDPETNSEYYNVVFGELRNTLMNRAKVIIGRTGYTTLLDLSEIKKKAILAPTKKMPEQCYLAKHLKEKGIFEIFNEDKLPDLQNPQQKLPSFILDWSTAKSLKVLSDFLDDFLKKFQAK